MTLFLVKVIDFLVEPLGFGLAVVLLGGVVTRWAWRTGYTLVGTGVAVLWLLSTPWMGKALIGSLEASFPPRPADMVPTADAIVVLGGGVGPATAPRLYPDLNDAGDRLWYGARLYRAGVASRVLVPGGRPPGRVNAGSPAMKTLLADWGIPADSIVVEPQSRTTYENARLTAQLCRERGLDEIVLVTSASHMWRSLATFRTTDLTVLPAPTDYRAVERPFTLLSVLPDANGLSLSTAAAHEYVGYLYYELRGWID
ncbi:MAG: YdcF family protein [Salinibacter sp.]